MSKTILLNTRPSRLLWTSAFLVLLLISTACQAPSHQPQLLIDDSVAPDLRSLAVETWQQFMVTFAARSDCFGDVSLRAVAELDGRAAYDASTASVQVRVPATAALLDAALVHEWAHHVEFQCADHEQMRSSFLAAQRLPSDLPWLGGTTWADRPSEQYAEAAVELVLGQRTIPTDARVRRAAVEVLADWAAGD